MTSSSSSTSSTFGSATVSWSRSQSQQPAALTSSSTPKTYSSFRIPKKKKMMMMTAEEGKGDKDRDREEGEDQDDLDLRHNLGQGHRGVGRRKQRIIRDEDEEDEDEPEDKREIEGFEAKHGRGDVGGGRRGRMRQEQDLKKSESLTGKEELGRIAKSESELQSRHQHSQREGGQRGEKRENKSNNPDHDLVRDSDHDSGFSAKKMRLNKSLQTSGGEDTADNLVIASTCSLSGQEMDSSVAWSAANSDPLALSVPTYGQVKRERSAVDTWHLDYSPELPKELLLQCQSHHCELCGVGLSSPIVAKSHYWGRSHERAVDEWIKTWSCRSGNCPPRKKLHPSRSLSDGFGQGEDQHYCHLCGIDLTSKIVALTHYQGKNHAKQKRKAQQGLPTKASEMGASNSSFGLGWDFAWRNMRQDAGEEEREDDRSEADKDLSRRFFCIPCQLECSSEEEYGRHVWSSDHKAKSFSEMSETPHFWCDVCQVQFGDQGTMDKHLAGTEHTLKQIRGQNDTHMEIVELRDDGSVFCTVCNVECNTMAVMDVHLQGKKHQKKVGWTGVESKRPIGGSAFERVVGAQVGSGRFYCDVCHVETTDQNGLNMHKEGKKHGKRMAQVMQSSNRMNL